MSAVNLKDRVALITGASRGIGAAVAKAYAKAGAHVILLARTVGGLEEVDDAIQAEGGQATLMPLDLLKLDDLDKLGPTIYERFGKLDIFVGNAAMMGTLTPLVQMNAKEWQKVMDLNVTANFRLLRTLDPLLKKSDAGRVVMLMSSNATFFSAYKGFDAISKSAVQAMLKVYAAETAKTSIRANLVDPGIADTGMLAEVYPGGYQGPYEVLSPETVAQSFLELVAPSNTRHGELISLLKEKS